MPCCCLERWAVRAASCLVDARGDSREETRAGILARLPARLSSEAAASTTAIAKSQSRLKQLEQVTADRSSLRRKKGEQFRIAYLRSTSSPGSAAWRRGDAHQWFRQRGERTRRRASESLVTITLQGLDETKTNAGRSRAGWHHARGLSIFATI